MRGFILFCIFCLTGTAAAAPGLDVLDTVFLFPIDSSNQVFPNVALKDAIHEGLITRLQLDSVLVAAQSFGIRPAPGSAFNTLPNWKVVAFRYDPCSPDTPGGDDCMQELRVVAQPFTAAGPVDTSMHITYGLGRAFPRADDPILQDLLRQKQMSYDRTKVLTAGFPLGTHPVLHQAMLNQGKGYALPILDFLRKYAVPGRLKKITMMGLKNASAQSWTFFGGDVVNGQWQLRSIANSPDSSGQMIDFDLNSSDRLFFPVPENKYLSTYGFFHRETLGEGEIDIFRQNLHVIENPRQSNRNTVDCLSCHSATSIKMDINQGIPKFVAGKTFAMPVRTT
ncbi:MAG: hypothetical protein EOP07_26810, partial [Proteobacteria bacterium]